jgi:hypothetical protein
LRRRILESELGRNRRGGSGNELLFLSRPAQSPCLLAPSLQGRPVWRYLSSLERPWTDHTAERKLLTQDITSEDVLAAEISMSLSRTALSA